MRQFLWVLMVIALLVPAGGYCAEPAKSETAKKPAPVDMKTVLEMRALNAERLMYLSERQKLESDHRLLQRLLADKEAQLQGLLREEARKAGVKLEEGWEPNPQTGEWEKRPRH